MHLFKIAKRAFYGDRTNSLVFNVLKKVFTYTYYIKKQNTKRMPQSVFR